MIPLILIALQTLCVEIFAKLVQIEKFVYKSLGMKERNIVISRMRERNTLYHFPLYHYYLKG